MLFLVILGAGTLVFVLAALFTSFTDKEIEISSYTSLSLGSPPFKRAVESITGSLARPLDGSITIFHNGEDFLEDLLAECAHAASSIVMTDYIFHIGEMADRTLDALAEAASRGVEVRLLLDDHGADKAPGDKLKTLAEAGGKIARFRPVSFRTLTRLHRRTHVRAIAIDGSRGYMGGMAFQDEWLGSGVGKKSWRDLMFKVDGSLGRAVADQFNNLWRQTDGEILTGETFSPLVQEKQEVGSSWFTPLLHAPAPDVSADLLDLIWLTISGAKSHLYLATPYLTPPDIIVKALAAAVERGVEVDVVVPGPHTDSKLIQSATRSYYRKLLKAGVRICEYQPGRFHAKFLTADGHWSLVGSANMDNRSATLNVENVFGIEDERFAAALEAEFAADRENAREVTPENFHPNIFKIIYYRLMALFTKQF